MLVFSRCLKLLAEMISQCRLSAIIVVVSLTNAKEKNEEKLGIKIGVN